MSRGDFDDGNRTQCDDIRSLIPDLESREESTQVTFRVPVHPAGLTSDPSGPATMARSVTEEELLHADGQTTELEGLAPITPPAPIPLPLRTVSGRYRSQPLGFQLELRVDGTRWAS